MKPLNGMRIRLVGPPSDAHPTGSPNGNVVTVERWERLWTELGAIVTVGTDVPKRTEGLWDVFVGLHATKSAAAIERAHKLAPERPIVIGIGGTDLYGGRVSPEELTTALRFATRIVVLQPLSRARIARELRPLVRVIPQSFEAPADLLGQARNPSKLEVCVLGNLREEKDPLLAARAVRLLDPTREIEIIHVGRALTPELEAAARAEDAANPRYRWLGGLPRAQALELLAASGLHLLTSRVEGAPSVLAEALALGVPTLATRIDATVGLLDAEWPGLFPVGDAEALAQLLERALTDPAFIPELRARTAILGQRVNPARERAGWRDLLLDLRD